MRAPPSVLVVDDEILVRWSIMKALTKAGFDVVSSDSAESAFVELENRHFDLVIADLKLPGEDGFSVTRRVQQLHPSSKIILLTAQGDDEVRQRAKDAGIDKYLDKPAELGQIIWSVRRLVSTDPSETSDD